jgi:glycosyltransferase involved in cell wall biosynthesis
MLARPTIPDGKRGAVPAHRRPPPLVSLIMPVWRPQAEWLAQAVMTALAQREARIELVLVEDGSAEPLEELLSELGDERVRLLQQPHGGAYAARNAGIAAARGEFVRFVDADDVFHPDSTARLVQLAEGERGAIAYGATLFCDADLRPQWKMTSRLRGDAVLPCLLSRFSVRPGALLFPRAVVEATGEWDTGFRLSGDWDWVLRALEHAPVRGERQVATYYRRHSEAMTADYAAGEEGARRVVRRYFERHPDQLGTAVERRAEATLHARAVRVNATHGRRRECFSRLGRSLLLDPRAAGNEAMRALPALWGRLRHAPAAAPRLFG